MHGTLLNGDLLENGVAEPLNPGDEVTFGSSVYRNEKTFTPATVTVGIQFRTPSVLAIYHEAETILTTHISGQADHSPSRVFTVPDDCSTDENEPLDDNVPLKMTTYSSLEINPWKNEQHNAVAQVDGIIEIDSGSESESDVVPHDCISIQSSDSGHDAADSRHLAAEIDDDDESISLTDDEEASSAPASPVESIDLDDLGLMDNVGDRCDAGARSPSWNSVSTDPHSDDAEEQRPSDHNSEDEQGVFLYDTESEEMDDIDPIDIDFVPYPEPVGHYLPAQTTLPPQPLPSVHPILPSIDTAVLSQQDVPQFNCRLAPVMQPAPRQPSPSDAVLPVGRRHHGSEDDCGVTVESLGLKSGKLDFFKAREQNKITVAHSRNHYAPDANAFVQNSSDTARSDEDSLRPVTGDTSQYSASSATAPTFNNEAHMVTTPQAPQPLAGRMKSQGSGGPSSISPEAIPLALEALSTAPLKDTPEMEIEAQETVDPEWTAASARELFVKQQQALMRAKMATLYDQAKAPVASECSETPKDTAKGKRKAVDISEATNPELVWHEQSAVDQQSVPSSPAPVQPEIEMDLSRLSFHNTPEQRPTAVRPTKMRKIAERVGYAALGGATVGAMVLTSLIYTAPNFA